MCKTDDIRRDALVQDSKISIDDLTDTWVEYQILGRLLERVDERVVSNNLRENYREREACVQVRELLQDRRAKKAAELDFQFEKLLDSLVFDEYEVAEEPATGGDA